MIAGALFTSDPIFEKKINLVQESNEYVEETEDEYGDPPSYS